MNCLYCDKKIDRYTFYGVFIEEDKLCLDCRKALMPKRRKTRIDAYPVTYFYQYDLLFKDLLLQYKECYDEALKDVFLYRIALYIKLRYFDYQILYVPSSKRKLETRGFNHLKEIFEPLGFKEVEGLEKREEISQEGKDLSDRKKMLGNFYYTGKEVNKVLIVDDVLTTGSTIRGVIRAMEGKCKVIRVIILAKVK